ncbi:MAG: aspartate carbamoyltransferase catalytic subunit [Alphaproteobacteria bacterium]
MSDNAAQNLLNPSWQLGKPHLLAIEGLEPAQITAILDIAQFYADHDKNSPLFNKLLEGYEVINLFFENSTRTRTSFESAAIRLGAKVINIVAEASSIKKGETLIDTAMTLNAMSPDVLVVRHGAAGAVSLLSQKVDAAVINAGDGAHEHPTQALLDALTIRQHCGRLHNLKIAICGDITHSRVARSNIHLLNAMGAEVRVIAPPTLLPAGIREMGAIPYTDMIAGLEACDIVMMLRLQQERMQGSFVPSVREYFHFYGLDQAKLSHAKSNALIMHPGPMNRGVEIDSDIADHQDRSLIKVQVAMGVAVRMAILDILTRPKRNAASKATRHA